jgi:autotransporter-associated beta strand protein
MQIFLMNSPHRLISLNLRMAVAIFSFICGSGLAQTTNTNTVNNGGTINVTVTEVITNPVTSITAAITNNGSLQFWQSTALTDSGIISGIGTVTKATGSGNLTLSGANTFSGKVTISSGTLTASGVSDTVGSGLGLGTQVELGGSGANLQVTVGAGATNTTSRQLILNNSATLGNGGNGSLVWNGNTVFNTNTTAALLFNSGGTGTNVFGGIIGNTTNNSAVRLDFQATQIWSLTGSNTFSGGITIGGGKVIADKLANSGTASSIGTAGNIRFGYFNNAPSTFEYVGSGSTNNLQVRLGASAGTINNTASFLQNGSGALVLTNAAFTLTGDGGSPVANRVLVLGGTNAADNTITGIIANSGANTTLSIVKADAGKWILSGANTYTGGTTISNGILQIGAGGTTGSVQGAIANNGSLIFNRSDATTVANVISGSGSVTKNAANTLTLSGANTFSGNVTIGGGTLAVTSVADSGASSLGTGTQLTLGGSATVSFTANSSNNTTRSLVLGGTGGNALKNWGSGALVWSGNVINNTTANGADFTLGGSGTGGNEFSGLLTNNGANAMRLIKNETGTWKLSGANTFSGLMDLFNGTLVVTTMANSGTASSVGAGTTIRFGGFAGETGVLEYVGSGSTNNRQFKLGGGGTANTGGTILNNGTGALVFNNATFNATGDGAFSGTTRALTLGGSNAADNAISGVIGNNNAGASTNNTVSVVKDGTGKWILSGANTYTGETTISNGTLQIGTGGTLASSGIRVSGGTFETTAANTVADTSTVNMSSGTYSLGGNDTVASLTVSGGLLSSANSSTLTAATYALNGGTVSANLGAGTVNASSGTTLLSGTSAAGTVNVSGGLLSLVSANRLADTAAVAVSSGELAVGGNDTVASLTVSGGLLSSANSSTLTATTYALNGGTVSANLGAGTVNSSSGTTLLSGTSAAANVNVSGGTLNTSGANKLADGAAVAVSSGTLGVGGSDTVGSLAASGTGVVTVASGTTLTANGNSSITGSARTTGGTVAIANNSNLTLANSSTTTTSDLSIGSGSTLAGTGGTSGQIKGSGLLSPGNSPGILTSGSVDLTGGIDFAFEFTAAGAPTYSLAGNSKNDLLHLTSGSTPFSGSFSADNTVSFYFNDSGLSASLASVTPTTYMGGFFVDTQNFNIAGLLSSATLQYFIAAANGTTSFNGVNYDLMSNEVASRMILSNVNQSAADFTTGTVSGTVLGVMAVPEPSSGSLLLAGIASLLVLRRFRKKA